MDFITAIGGLGLSIYQVETDNRRERNRLTFERQRALETDKSNSKIMVIGAIVLGVLGVVWLRNRKG
ncbi:MAG: hypothetical protein COB56_01085 [Robiginitomaculum sp.]|nr:MAG: hypothetical protein COB56_01085 [Robiginitomaculum sp.]